MAKKTETLNTTSKRISFFKSDLAKELHPAFSEAYEKNDGSWTALVSELKARKEFDEETIKKLDFTYNLATWTKDHAETIAVFQEDKSTNSMRDIALNFNKKEFIEKIETIAPGKSAGEKRSYAENLHNRLFHIAPTAMVVNMIKDPKVNVLNNTIGAHVASVLEKQPEFDIKRNSVYNILKNEEALKDVPADSKEAVKSELKILQRIVAVSPATDAVEVLYNAGLHTAFQISEMPPAQFKKALKNSKLDEKTISAIHANAQRARVRGEHALMALREASKPTGVSMIDKSLKPHANSVTKAVGAMRVHELDANNLFVDKPVEDQLNEHNLSWNLLFGDADFCECGECTSVYSAASYYVELLQYLRNNNLDDESEHTAVKGITGTPVEQLFKRRPDLGCLELTCKNTNTVLPYVDLVNEVMENYVAFKKLKPFNVDEETSSELLAEPQHTEYQAYCILKKEVYPFTLPYHQPIDAARTYLEYLQTSRYEVIRTFRKNNAGSDEDLTKLKDEAIDRAVDAEYLRLTKEEYVILTKECFERKALVEKIENKTLTDSEYQKMIGVKPVCKYYGYDDDASMLADDGLTLIKKEFLRRTGIDYFNLVDLLKTQFINPLLPKGKAKAIAENLHLSYRVMQELVRLRGIDAMAKILVTWEEFADLLTSLKEGLSDLLKKRATVCENPGGEQYEITDKDIIHWVKCNYEKMGKMIVIESGRGCVNGRLVPKEDKGGMWAVALSIEECVMYVYNGKRNADGTFAREQIGTVDKKTGKVQLNDELTQFDLTQIVFKGAKGEKGFFVKINDVYYLKFTEQKDSCDLDTALLQHLDGSPLTTEEYDRIHRFIRLWRKVGWTIDETDKAISGLSFDKKNAVEAVEHTHETSICVDSSEECNDDCNDCDDCGEPTTRQCDINATLIQQLASVKKLLDKTGLELAKLLAFWSDISIAGDNSLYKRLFLKHNILGVDKVFKANAAGNYLTQDTTLTEHIPVIMASLNLSAAEIRSIMTEVEMTDKLTLGNVSLLYRYRLLSKAVGLKIDDFIRVLPLFGDVFESARETLRFLCRWERMEAAGFTHQQLNYIIRGVDDVKRPFTPNEKVTLLLVKSLYDGLNAIDYEHKDLVADPTITDNDAKRINIQEQATATVVRNKSGLLFDSNSVDAITGYLEGTAVYSTNAPRSLSFTITPEKSLFKKLTYSPTNGTIQILGILTEAESIDFKSLSNNSGWSEALTRIEKQQARLFKELFAGILEKTADATVKADFEKVIKSGDISIPLDQIHAGEEDTNTAAKKRVMFLKVFLPYMRQELSHRLIVSTLANFTGLDNPVIDLLITKLLSVDGGKPIYEAFEKIKASAAPSNRWEGYLSSPVKNTFTIVVKQSDDKPRITLNGEDPGFVKQDDPTTEWWSANRELEAGKLYKLNIDGVELKNIYWKTSVTAVVPIPTTALIPDLVSGNGAITPSLVALKKASIWISTFNLSADELNFLHDHKADFNAMDFNAISLTHWLRLDAYTRLRNSIPQTKLSILDFWKWVRHASSQATGLTAKIGELTNWKRTQVDKLIAGEHFGIVKLSDFYDEKNLLKLQKALAVVDKVAVDIDLLFDWAVPTSKFKKCREIAEGIRNAIRSKYNASDWEVLVKPLQDKLRNNQKEALIAYLLQQKELIEWNVTDANGLFEYFLIDVQMDACMQTSRIKQAISSVQLFIQRCFLGLESKPSKIGPGTLDRKRWEWMSRYRVWEANRKVFLYPENYIETNLRDDKSVFFKELESELLQKDINMQNVSDALKAYLYKVDEVANMEVVGLYIDNKGFEDNRWADGSRLHVFSRTRNAPYFFYYRYLALDEMNWYPWEKVQVDIPSYDVENGNGSFIGNGCHLTPVAWNGRLLIFFPQIAKKTKPNPNTGTSFRTLGDSQTGITNSRPVEYYEIKMAWSEYRNKKWTQKQITKDAIETDPRNTSNCDIQWFKFVPLTYPEKIVINIDWLYDFDGSYKKAFEFNGNAMQSTSPVPTAGVPIDYFGQSTLKLYSWQIVANTGSRENTSIYFWEDAAKNEMLTGISGSTEFHSETSHELLARVNSSKLSDLFGYNLLIPDDANAFGLYDPNGGSANNAIYHELKKPYSLYNWETFFHTPMTLGDALSKSQQFEEAMKWYHNIFDPTAKGPDDTRFWQFLPFQKTDSQRVLDKVFENLKPNQSDQAVSEWRDKPFMPHVVARSRPVAYMKWVVMKYMDNLIAWGDHLFRQDTIESINQATQLYVLAWHILGERPMMIPRRGKVRPRTYLSLLDKWDAFGNAMVELELAAPFSNQVDVPFEQIDGELAFANVFGLASSLYFCIPNNPKLMGYWDTIEDRLYKIRHCENIEGVFRQLPLFEPPIDPALLVQAAAQGLSIASVLNDLNTPLPNYRFYYLLQKALELCGELKSMGNSLLSAIEKKDGETIGLLRARHESTMQNLVMEIKKKQLEEARRSLDTLEQNRKAPEHRMKYYLKLIGEDLGKVPGLESEFSEIANSIEAPVSESGLKLIRYEKEEFDKSHDAHYWQLGANAVEALSAIFHALPDATIAAMPFGVGGQAKLGGSHFGNASSAASKVIQIVSSQLSYESSNAGKKAGFLRALQDRIFQANSAGYEIKQIDKQITAQKIRIEIANQEIINQQKLIDNAQEVEEFLKDKYTNEELYSWMSGSLKTLYHQVYTLAFDLSKKAEKVYRFERGLPTSNFISAGYWDAGRNGLLAGERLYVGLKQMEAAYQNERGYDYEITKNISLRLVNPLAILQLRETGECEFAFPEVLFDMDYPGHYKRRIKSVSISIPCVVGPHTGINATLRLLENKFRNTSIGGKTYEENLEETDARFSNFIIPINAIATSSAQNDSGMFELNFKDERYLPYEGAGTTSKWRLELPEIRQFDYNTISDVIIHVRYTSCEGGERLKAAAIKSVTNYMKNNEELAADQGLFSILDLKHDLPSQWHKAITTVNAGGNREIEIDKIGQFIPYYMQGNNYSLKVTDVIVATDIHEEGFNLNEASLTNGVEVGGLNAFALSGQSLALADLKKLGLPEKAKDAKQMFLITKMTLR